MLVRDYMTRRVLSFGPNTEVLKALHVMHENDISNAPVVDEQRALCGIFSDRDCIRGVLQGTYHSEFGGLVSEFMSPDVKTVGPDDGIIDTARCMTTLPFRLYPVVTGGELIGVISRRDIIKALTGKWQWAR